MKKLATSAAGAMLLLASVTACGGDDGGSSGDSYCDDLESARTEFASFGEADFDKFDEAIETLKSIGDNAPDEVADDWDVLTGALDKFQTALDDAGIDPADLGDPNLDPSQFDPEALQALTEVAEEMDSTEVTEASDAIQEHAKSECDIDLEEDPTDDSGN